MEIIEIDSVYKYLKDSIFIGRGTTAYCFLKPDNTVVKIYNHSSSTAAMFSKVDMVQRLNNIHNIQNDTYIGPEKLIMKNGELIGYIYPYIDAPTLQNTSLKTTIFDLYKDCPKLIEDTKKISDLGFRLYDVHHKNILFNGNYYVIDLDKGRINDIQDYLIKCNMSAIKETVIGYLFNVKPWEVVIFDDEEINYLYKGNSWTNEEQIYNFFETLAKKTDISNPSVKQLRRKIGYKKYYNEYYH